MTSKKRSRLKWMIDIHALISLYRYMLPEVSVRFLPPFNPNPIFAILIKHYIRI